jgi:hypothetical protein
MNYAIKIKSVLANEDAPHAGYHTVVAHPWDSRASDATFRGPLPPKPGDELVLVANAWEHPRQVEPRREPEKHRTPDFMRRVRRMARWSAMDPEEVEILCMNFVTRIQASANAKRSRLNETGEHVEMAKLIESAYQCLAPEHHDARNIIRAQMWGIGLTVEQLPP